jgi:hypothetical protein
MIGLIAFAQFVLVTLVGMALGLVYAYLRWRGQLDALRRLWLPALLWTVFGTLDALATTIGTWDAPWNEGNPTTRAFLIWGGWVGLVIGTFLYVLFWAAVVLGLEALRRRSGRVWASVLGGAQLLILYALAMGHLWGFLTWTPLVQVVWPGPLIDFLSQRAPWLYAISPLGYGLYFGLILGAICTALHLGIAALTRQADVPTLGAGPTSQTLTTRDHPAQPHTVQ